MIKSVRVALSVGGSLCAIGAALAQNTDSPARPGVTPLPDIEVTEPKWTAEKHRNNLPKQTSATSVARRQTARRAGQQHPSQQQPPQSPPDLGVGLSGASNVPPLQVAPALGKTGTRLEDLPASVQVIPRDIVNQQGGNSVLDAITNASGIVEGGQDGHYFDLFLIRGLNAQIYNDGFSDGDQLGGLSHSLNGVKQVEILEGPGSALFGSGPPGGTVNIVHFTPSSDFHYGASLQGGSFGTITGNGYVTGPTSIPGLSYRVDGTASHTDGFRDLKASDYELRPDILWNVNNHALEFTLDARQLHQTPDSYGIIYFKGSPLSTVPIDAKYSWPFSSAVNNYIRPSLTDKWWISDFLTINNRFSYLNRSLDILRTGDSSKTAVDVNPNSPTFNQVTNLQLRKQHDFDNTLDYQFEPVWKFATGGMSHTLLTGFEFVDETIDTQRSTAALPNIPNAFAPVPPMVSANSLTFLCKPGFSCDNDHLAAQFLSLYATDQIDVTDKLKVRAGVRQEWWDTALTPLINVPGRVTNEGTPLVANTTQIRHDTPVSWNVGALYKLFPGISPYVGVSKSFLSNFNSENTQTGIGAPESAMQYEAGVKFSLLHDRLVLNTAVFDVSRNNVATPATAADGSETVVFDGQRTTGFETSLDAKITDQWRLLANFTAQKAVVTDDPSDNNAFRGNHPQGVPAYMANLWSTYKFSIAGVPGFTVGLGVNYRDKSYSDTTNVNSIPAFVVGNALFAYDADTWGVSLNVKNFTNQRYYIEPNAAGAVLGESLSAFVKLYVKG